jgi:hypothetical protein
VGEQVLPHRPISGRFDLRLNREYLNADGVLNFDDKFDQMNEIIKRFMGSLHPERINLNQNAHCLLPDSKVKELLKSIKGNANGMCGGRNHPLQLSVNDFSNWQELESFFKARCVISGNNVMLSSDRKIDSTGRYNCFLLFCDSRAFLCCMVTRTSMQNTGLA